MSLLTPDEIHAKLKDLTGWELKEKCIRKEFMFPTFSDAMVFVNEVAQYAEDVNHHPDIEIHYNNVVLTSVTHDMEGVTEKDIELASRAQEAEKMIFGDLSKA